MSGVPERLRNLSSFEFYNTAVELRVEVLGIITSSAIPKSHRFTFAVPMAETARSVVYNIVKGQAFYPSSPENVAARKRHYTLAIADCEQLYQDAQAYLEMYRRKGDIQHAGAFERMAELVDSEVKLLKGARSGVKLIKRGGGNECLG